MTMRDEANVTLIRTVIRDMEEFIHEHDPKEFSSDEEVTIAFFHFLQQKHKGVA